MTARFVLAGVLIAMAGCRGAQKPPEIHPDIHFVATPDAVIDAMLKLANVTSSDVVYDLGSGDGRIVVAAAQKYGVRAVGVELDPELNKKATERARKAGVADLVTFKQGDLFKADLSQATVVTLFLSYSVNLRLEEKLRHELRPGARIVSHRFPIGNWRPDEDLEIAGTHVYLWRV